MSNNPTPAAPSQPQPTLAHATFSAIKWNYAGTAVRMAVTFVVGVILARLLGPKPYGQVAVATLVIGLGSLGADMGLGSALVQKEKLSAEDIRIAFTLQILFAIVLTGTIWLLAPWIAVFFHQSETLWVIRALVPMFFLQALGQTAANLLKRDLQQGKIQAAQLVSYLLGYIGLGVPLAFAGAGVWSLVAAQLAQSFFNSLLVYFFVRHSVIPVLRSGGVHLLQFGGKAVSTNFASWSIGNLDNLFVGRNCGALGLGLYSRSYTLLSMPTAALVSTLQAVLFPAYSRTQNRPQLMRQTYLASVAVIAMLTLPLFAVVAVIPHAVIGGIYGSRWIAAVPVVVPLALAMPLDSLMALAGPVLWGIGRVEREMWVQIATAVVMAGVMMVMSRISFVAVGWGVLMIYLFRVTLVTRAVIRTLEIQWIDIGRAIRVAALVALGTAMIVGGVDHVLLARVDNMGLHLAADAAVAALSYGVLIAVTFSHWPKETRLFLDQIAKSSRALERMISILARASSSNSSIASGEEG